MKLKKILKSVLGVIGTLLLLAVLTVLFWLGPTIKLVAQTVGTKALGTPIHVEKLSINPIKGIIHLSDFSIKNPDMFGQSNAVSVASLDLAIDMSSIFTSTIVVHQVEINSPYFIYEQDISSDNISEFIRSIQQFAKIDPSAPPKPKKEKKKKTGTPKNPTIVIVESLAINDVQFNLANTYDEKLDIGVGFGQLAISMTNGTVRLDNLYVNNPIRLETPHLFTLDTVNIQLEPGSIYSTNIHFESVEILNPHAFIEYNPETDTLSELLKIASSLMAKTPTNTAAVSLSTTLSVAETETSDPDPPKAPPPGIRLDMLVIDDVQLHSVNIGDPLLDIHLGLNHFSVALEDGRVELERLYLSNPARLSTPDLLSLDRFSLQIKPGSHKAETLVIEDIQVIKPHAFLELNPESHTVREFLKIVNGYTDRMASYEFPQLPPTPEAPVSAEPVNAITDPEAPPPFELHNLTVDDIELQLLDLTNTNTPSTGPHMIVGIESVLLKLFEGQLHVNNIRIPNTAGFTASNIFNLASIDVAMEPGSIHTDQFIVNEIRVDSPTVNLEQTEEAGNVSTLQHTLMQLAPKPEELPQIAAKPEAAEEAPSPTATNVPIPIAEQPFVLHQLLVTNLSVNLSLPVSTNESFQVRSLNPMEHMSLNKLNPLAKESAETTTVEESPVELIAFDQLSLEPLKGLLSILNMRISNPPGFSKKNLIQLDEFRFDIDSDTIQTDTLHIEDVMITKPRIRYERKLATDNIKALQSEIEQAVMRREKQSEERADTVSQAKQATEAEGAETAEGQKVIIDRVLVIDGMVQAKLSALPAIPVPLPTIELNDLGKETGGTSLADAGNKIFTSLYDAIIGSVGGATGFAGDTLKGFGNLTFDTLESVVDGVTGTTREKDKTVNERTEDVEKKSTKRRFGGRRRRF